MIFSFPAGFRSVTPPRLRSPSAALPRRVLSMALATEKSGGVVLQKNYSGETRRAVHQFTNDLVETLTGQKGIALSEVAFVADRTGHKEIYTCDYDGARTLQLTHDGAISVSPALSPDGRRLAYTGYQSGYADIYLVDLTSGARNRIIKFPGTNSGAAFSPDGIAHCLHDEQRRKPRDLCNGDQRRCRRVG